MLAVEPAALADTPGAAGSLVLRRLDGKPWQCGKDATNALARKIARRPVRGEFVLTRRPGAFPK